jgi:hypothetical protein
MGFLLLGGFLCHATSWLRKVDTYARKVDIRLPEKENSNSHGARQGGESAEGEERRNVVGPRGQPIADGAPVLRGLFMSRNVVAQEGRYIC